MTLRRRVLWGYIHKWRGIPEGCILPKDARLLRALLFPIQMMRMRKESHYIPGAKYSFERDTVTFWGRQEWSMALLSCSIPAGQYILTVEDDTMRFERIGPLKKPGKPVAPPNVNLRENEEARP